MSNVKALVNVAGGRLAFGAVGAGYSTLLAATGSVGILIISNSLNTETVISLDNGTTDFLFLQAGASLTVDFSANDMCFSGTIRVKHNGAAPASGNIAASIIRMS